MTETSINSVRRADGSIAGATVPVRVRAALRQVRAQFQSDPYSRLMCEVVATALNDYFGVTKNEDPKGLLERDPAKWSEKKRSAAWYLVGSIPHAEACGVDSDWIRRIFNRLNLPMPKPGDIGQ